MNVKNIINSIKLGESIDFSSDFDVLNVFLRNPSGYNQYIFMFNAKCIASYKTKSSAVNKLSVLIEKYDLKLTD